MQLKHMKMLLGTTLLFLLCSTIGFAQDAPGKFEIGANLTAIRNFGLSSEVGLGAEGDFNFNRHFALDGALDWLPSNSFEGKTLEGLFGVKAGQRFNHFGLFGKVRPGFITIDNQLRGGVINLSNPASLSDRFGRLTQSALDLGGVAEYYPAKHWAFRWDIGDTLLFEEHQPTFTVIAPPGFPPLVVAPPTPGHTINQFQFSMGVHYRF
jgi:hypothetical protein